MNAAPAVAPAASPAPARPPGPGPRVSVPRQRRLRVDEHLPLGSLTQREHRAPAGCVSCGSTRLTRLSMNLADGASVDFVSCHHCEHRRWEEAGVDVPVAEVLVRTARR